MKSNMKVKAAVQKTAPLLNKDVLCALVANIAAIVFNNDNGGEDTERVDAVAELLHEANLLPSDFEDLMED